MKNNKSKINHISETDYNYHVTSTNIEGYGKPYASDNRYRMRGGRDTGHFGSGTYFSSYNTHSDSRSYEREYGASYKNKNPEFIKIKDGLYRVDMDFYKNLYKVESEKEGDILFYTLRTLNAMFNRLEYNVTSNAVYYQKIKHNCNALGLECPDYRKLTEIMLEYSKSDKIQSFSTYFMEMNGYNGVNVSGISKYDNTLYGSVIYDLSKTEGIRKVKPETGYSMKSWDYASERSSDAIAKTDYEDVSPDFLNGKPSYRVLRKFPEMDKASRMRYIKNIVLNGNMFDDTDLIQLDNESIKFYLKYLLVNIDKYDIDSVFLGFGRRYLDAILDNGIYQYANLYTNSRSMFITLLHRADSRLIYADNEEEKRKEILQSLFSAMKRPLNDEEKKYAEKFLEF